MMSGSKMLWGFVIPFLHYCLANCCHTASEWKQVVLPAASEWKQMVLPAASEWKQMLLLAASEWKQMVLPAALQYLAMLVLDKTKETCMHFSI